MSCMDARTVHRSLMNLVSNAIDACIFDESIKKNTGHVTTALEPTALSGSRSG